MVKTIFHGDNARSRVPDFKVQGHGERRRAGGRSVEVQPHLEPLVGADVGEPCIALQRLRGAARLFACLGRICLRCLTGLLGLTHTTSLPLAHGWSLVSDRAVRACAKAAQRAEVSILRWRAKKPKIQKQVCCLQVTLCPNDQSHVQRHGIARRPR